MGPVGFVIDYEDTPTFVPDCYFPACIEFVMVNNQPVRAKIVQNMGTLNGLLLDRYR